MTEFELEFLSKITKLMQQKEMINLAVGQPDFKPPAFLLDAYKKNIGVNSGYTSVVGLIELRELITKKLQKENNFKPEKVLITTGAAEAIFDTMLTYLSQGSEVILFSPYYYRYATTARILGAKVTTIDLKNGRPNLDNLENKITNKTKIIVLNSPSNPTGIVYTEEEIKKIVKIVEKYNLLLISDEVYEKYLYDNAVHISPASISRRVITINSFSKTYGFPGLRLGYLAGYAELVDPIIATHVANTTCSPYSSQMAIIEAMKQGYDFFNIASFDERRKIILETLDDLSLAYIYPQGAFYIYVYIHQNPLEFVKKLMKEKILVMPGNLYEEKSVAIRLSYATDKQKLRKGLEIFKKYF